MQVFIPCDFCSKPAIRELLLLGNTVYLYLTFCYSFGENIRGVVKGGRNLELFPSWTKSV